jgi:hypothetical protein
MFPNGIKRGKDGVVYIPSAFTNSIQVRELQGDGSLKLLHDIKIGMPVDNLAVDSKGDIYAAGMPKILELMETLDDPFNKFALSTVFRISKSPKGYVHEKVVEDKERRVLSGVGTARHDAKTGRIFMGGKLARFLFHFTESIQTTVVD